MLLTFSATNYKSIRETQTISFVGAKLKGPREPFQATFPGGGNGVLPCALIYGANAAGKSNIASAISTMHGIVLDSHRNATTEAPLPMKPFLLDEESEGNTTTFEMSFIVQSVRYDYGFSYNYDEIVAEWLFSYPETRRRRLFERKDQEIKFGSGMKGEKRLLEKFLQPNALFLSIATQNQHEELSAILTFFKEIYLSNRITVGDNFINTTFKNNEIDQRTIKFLEAVGTGVIGYKQVEESHPDHVKDMLGDLRLLMEKHLEPLGEVKLPEVEEQEYRIELEHLAKGGQRKFFAGSLESAGTRRLLILINKLFEVLDKGQIAVIDELDASLHTVAVKAILSLFLDRKINSKGAQIIATTHDTNLLDPSFLRRDEIWFVEKQSSGESHYFSLAEISARKDEVFERLYLDGRYGALPVIPDPREIQ